MAIGTRSPPETFGAVGGWARQFVGRARHRLGRLLPIAPPKFHDATRRLGNAALDRFLASGGRWDFAPSAPPRVAVILLLRGRAEVTFTCLESLASPLHTVAKRLVLVDNASPDRTPELLDRLDHTITLRNAVNVGFPAGVNQAVRAASVDRPDYLLLINNDTQLLGPALDAAAAYLDAHPDVGVVGGRLVHLEGLTQEAGGLVWRDGSTTGYGQGLPPDHPALGFERDVDYVSGAFLLTRRTLFEALGGLDEGYSPGYYEDCDYCFRAVAAGFRVVYRPDVAVLHHENASSSGGPARELLARNRARFVERHSQALSAQPACGYRDERALLWARHGGFPAPRVLVRGDAVHADQAVEIVLRLLQAGAFVTVAAPFRLPVPDVVEQWPLPDEAAWRSLRQSRRGYYRQVIDAATHTAADEADWP